ncbi:glutamic acid-rich protein-like [Daktulosphaira vitifoliae]|uniref:glutamic acid-rich protein-like n=1 Tax=Daktulosphaira vitifoliae TaxID=58002 RepID=UPI0021AA3D08|nr:glutamic acid-rich protein-like [Daktulosphaira vitifoliae]
MKLKTQNTTENKQKNNKKNDKSPKTQNKGAAKEKVKPIKPAVLKKEGEKVKAEQKSISPIKVLQNELWTKAIKVVADKSDLPDKESGIAKLLANYKKQDSIPRKETKLKNFILKGFSQYKDTESEILDSLYNKIKEAFESLGGQPKDGNSETKNSNNKVEKNSPKTKNLKKVEVENSDDDDEDDDNDKEDDIDEDDIEDVTFADSDEDVEGDSEEEVKETKPAGKNKANKKQVKNGNNKANNKKNNQKFKGGKVQKNKGKLNKKK